MVPVLGQELERLEPVDHLRRQRLAHRLETADQEAAGIVPDIEMTVMVAERGKVAFEALDRLG